MGLGVLKAASTVGLVVASVSGKTLSGLLPYQRLPRPARDSIVKQVVAEVAPSGQAPSIGCSAAISAISDIREAVAKVEVASKDVMQRTKHQAFAVPNIDACIKCDKPLTVCAAARTGKAAWFYPRYGLPGLEGTEYVATCSSCQIQYDLEGYQLVNTAGTREGPINMQGRPLLYYKRLSTGVFRDDDDEDDPETNTQLPTQAVELNGLSRHLPTEAGLPIPRRSARTRTPSVRLQFPGEVGMIESQPGRKRPAAAMTPNVTAMPRGLGPAAATGGLAPATADGSCGPVAAARAVIDAAAGAVAATAAGIVEATAPGVEYAAGARATANLAAVAGVRVADGFLSYSAGSVYTPLQLCAETVIDGEVYYQQDWSELTWEPRRNIVDQRLLDEWRTRCERVQPGTWDTVENLATEPVQLDEPGQQDLDEVLERAVEGVDKDRRQEAIASMRIAVQAREGKRQNEKFKYGTCGLRVGGKDGRLTAGCCWAMCPDGFLFPGFEMPDCESTRMVLYNILKWFENRPYWGRGDDKFVFVYDDMCHLLRFALKRVDLHPEIKRFTEASHAVDVFHFVKNHKGVWCDKMERWADPHVI
ncbi:hypothetical protein QJQ45_007861 [Haematococcus lacustris]|nr:hypothetical protein QJQ45_007861 [Haematococcus lacustris]